MKPEPLKGKLRDIGMGIFSYGDVKSAVEWLKANMASYDDIQHEKLCEQIDEAFEDVMKK